MPKGSSPGERRGGRQRGSRNKFSVSRMLAAMEANASGIDPQAALETISTQFLDAAEIEAQKSTAASRPRYFDLLDKAARVLVRLMPYRYPRLSAIQVGADPGNPLNLSVLSDNEVTFLYRTLLKAGATDKSLSPRGVTKRPM